MLRRDFLKLLALGGSAALGSSLMTGCSNLARTVSLEDKRHRVVEDNSRALAGEPTVTLNLIASNVFAQALPELIGVYTGHHPNISFAEPQLMDTTLVMSAIAGGDFDVVLFDQSTLIQQIVDREYNVENQIYSILGAHVVVIGAQGGSLAPADIKDVASSSVSRIYVGDPQTAWSGRFANQALCSAGLYSDQNGTDGAYDAQIADKVVVKATAEEVVSAVAAESGAVGIVLAPESFAAGVETLLEVPRQKYRMVHFYASQLSTGTNVAMGGDFVRWISQESEASRVVAPYGFVNDLL